MSQCICVYYNLLKPNDLIKILNTYYVGILVIIEILFK